MTEREYLVSLGLAKQGRGRYSNAAKEALAKARAEGKTFTDPSYKAPTPKTPKPETETAIVKRVSTPKDVREASPRVYPEGTQFEHVTEDNKRYTVSEATVCANSGVSLGWCGCEKHRGVVSDVRLGLVPLTRV